MIHEKFRRYLDEKQLTKDFTVQYIMWTEKPDSKIQRYIVIQPDGGTGRFQELGADDFIQVILVSAKSDPAPAIKRAQEILDYVRDNPASCELNSVFNMGGLTKPIPTIENRFIIQLSFRCLS